jgi:site-specific recombinase XerD
MQNERLVREYLGWLRDTRTRRAATVYGYATVFEQFLLFLGGRQIAAVELRELEAFLLRPRPKVRGPRPSASTLRREGAVLRGLYSYLSARGYVERNPAALLASPSRPRRDPRVIGEDVWLSVWTHPKLSAEARVVLGLGYFAGLRRAEIANLRSDHVDVAHRTLRGRVSFRPTALYFLVAEAARGLVA